MDDEKEKLVPVCYKLADGKSVSVEVSESVACFLEAERKREQTSRRNDRRFLDAAGYIEGETELLLYDLGILGKSVLDEVQERERGRLINEAIARLPVRQKNYVHAYYFKALTYTEIAEREGVSSQAVGESVRLALKRLKRILGGMERFQAYLCEVTDG